MKKGTLDYQNRFDKKRFKFSQSSETGDWIVEDTSTRSFFGWSSYEKCRKWANERASIHLVQVS